MAITKQASCTIHANGFRILACALQWLLALAVASCGGSVARAEGVSDPLVAPLDGPVEVAPLASMRLTGGFGELRSNHFHAGLDLSTGGRVGAAVRAPLACTVERVRASGVGYGRSLYVRAADGRLFVFGHLDAFAPALAAYVDSTQRASTQYEQDLWPPAGRFRFASGDTLAWSGESGAGAPHLHVEVRHGDFALSPLRAGLSVPRDDGAPVIESVVLEPISLGALVERRASPFTWRPGMRDTIVVRGAARAIVRARSGLAGAGDVPAWSTAIEWSGWTIEARLDSISWAGEMAQLDWLVDRGRVNGSAANGGMILWAAPGARPRFLRTNVPEGVTGGTLVVSPGEAARPLLVRARDVNGRESTRTLWLRAPRTEGEMADTVDARAIVEEEAVAGSPRWECFGLPDPKLLRLRMSGAPRGLRGVHFTLEDTLAHEYVATWDGQAWSAIVRLPWLPYELSVRADGTMRGTPWSRNWRAVAWPAGEDYLVQDGALGGLSLGADRVFEPGVVVTAATPLTGALGRVLVQPARFALAKGATVRMTLPPGAVHEGVGLFRRPPAGSWDFVRASWDSAAHTLSAETSTLGEFALLRDLAPPVVRTAKPPRRVPAGAYPRWQLVAHGAYPRWQLVAQVSDALSGIDARQTRFVVDGKPVPSEWDPEERQLRWRPLAPPGKGRHLYEVVATDRAGLVTRARGTFVLDSARQ